MLLNFFKNSAAVIESLDDLGPTCKQVAEEIKKFTIKATVFC